MVKVNLLPKEDIEKKAIGKFLKWTLSYGRYIIICVELVVFVVFFSRFIYDQKLADIAERVEQKQAIIASASDFEERIRSIQRRIEEVKSLDNGRTVYIAVLERLKEIIPKDMVFTEFGFEQQKLTITGETQTNESFARFITDLKASSTLLSEISIESVGKKGSDQSSTQNSQDENVVSFTITANVIGYEKYEPSPTVVPVQAPQNNEEEL
jgi:Tfp pilus assembly protein PilN